MNREGELAGRTSGLSLVVDFHFKLYCIMRRLILSFIDYITILNTDPSRQVGHYDDSLLHLDMLEDIGSWKEKHREAYSLLLCPRLNTVAEPIIMVPTLPLSVWRAESLMYRSTHCVPRLARVNKPQVGAHSNDVVLVEIHR